MSVSTEEAMKSEEAAYKKRAEESKEAGVDGGKRPPRGGDPPPEGRWEWTLNWDPVVYGVDGESPEVIVGSCPRTPADVDRLVDEAGIEAILCLQCGDCHTSMDLDWEAVRRRSIERGVLMTRVSVRDFDRLDQATMLPEMTKMLGLCVASGRRTYVHCTAGINRANLAVLGYMTFVLGMDLEVALSQIRSERPQANPYVDSWQIARQRMLAGREQELYLITQVDQGGNSMAEGGDWILRDWTSAEKELIKRTMERRIEADLVTVETLEQMNRKGYSMRTGGAGSWLDGLRNVFASFSEE
eukprot:CAMPEP_0182861258 /NCGR_PEP_ID=MMETSP0034_2-20130328/5393_1 /TAXON_ID=156128 /ORGANISM="Nephroselmis pyriformis, Strain CCMP717" /LENGTH=299 /DNA_ID=CAMNT_0024993167 /DNA_START=75 /DNA_END=974 /DNA_ORIENTATION=-